MYLYYYTKTQDIGFFQPSFEITSCCEYMIKNLKVSTLPSRRTIGEATEQAMSNRWLNRSLKNNEALKKIISRGLLYSTYKQHQSFSGRN